MSYKKVPSTKTPKNERSKWFTLGIVFMSLFVFWIFVFKPYLKNFKNIPKDHVEMLNGYKGIQREEVLKPGIYPINTKRYSIY